MLKNITPTFRAMKLIAVTCLLYLAAVTSAHAQAAGWWTFGVFTCPTCVQTPMYLAQVTKDIANQVEELTWKKAQAQIEEQLKRELQKKANEVSATVTNKLNAAVQNTVGNVLGGPVGQILATAGVSTDKVVNQPGKSNVRELNTQIQDLKNNTNPTDAIAAQTALMIQNQIADRLNVTSMLDEKPVGGTCKSASADKCTILTILREQDATALDELQKVNIAAIGFQVAMKGQWSKSILDQVDKIAGTSDLQVLSFLTPSPAISLGFEANAQNAQTLKKSMWLSQILVGTKNDTQFLTRSAQDKQAGTTETTQIEALSKIAKIQLARSAVMNVHNEYNSMSFNSQFRACVVRPDAQDRIGSTEEQQLVHIQALLRCRNMMLLQLRQQKMEDQRLQGTMLLTLLDLYAVQERAKSKTN